MKPITLPKWFPVSVLLVFTSSTFAATTSSREIPTPPTALVREGPVNPYASDAPPESIIATATAQTIVARTAPNEQAGVIASFSRYTADGGPQVFLLTTRVGEDPSIEDVETRDDAWLEAFLPIRPNGTTGFIPADSVVLSQTPYRVTIERDQFELSLWKGARVIERMPVGLGTGKTPTPVGRFYLTVLLEPPNPGGLYGRYAFGLSGFSEVLLDWEGGGVVGVHGTNDPSSIGRKSSHGCIRMLNKDITRLVRTLPLGTPIQIL